MRIGMQSGIQFTPKRFRFIFFVCRYLHLFFLLGTVCGSQQGTWTCYVIIILVYAAVRCTNICLYLPVVYFSAAAASLCCYPAVAAASALLLAASAALLLAAAVRHRLCAGRRNLLLWFIAPDYKVICAVPLGSTRMYVQPRFTCNPTLIIHVMHPRKLRACAEPRRAAARRGEASLVCMYIY